MNFNTMLYLEIDPAQLELFLGRRTFIINVITNFFLPNSLSAVDLLRDVTCVWAQRCGSAWFTMRRTLAWTSASARTMASSCQSSPSSTSWCASHWGCATMRCWSWSTSPTRCPWPCRMFISSTWPSRALCSTSWRPWSCWAPPSPAGMHGSTTTRSTSPCSSSSISPLWSSCIPPRCSVWTTI